MKRLKNENGGAIMPIIYIIAIISALYAAYMFGIPYYKYSTLSSECKAIARLSQNKGQILELVYDKVKELDVPVPKENITVEVAESRVTIKMTWDVRVDLMGVYQRDLHFDINVTQ